MPEPASSPRVLVVDGDESMRILVEAILAKAGFASETAADGVEALGLLVASPFDLVISDLHTPRVDGLTLAARMRERGLIRNTRLVLLSARPDDEARVRGLAGDGFLLKPFQPTALLAEVRRVLALPPADTPPNQALVPRPAGERTRALSRNPAPAAASGAREPTSARLPRVDLAHEGPFGEVRPEEICKIFHRARRSGQLVFRRADSNAAGFVVVRDGEVFAAHIEDGGRTTARGEAALEEILGWRAGTFVFEAGSGPVRDLRNIARPTARVITEATGSHATLSRTRLGPFEVLETLSEGTQASVHRAARLEPRGGGGGTGQIVRLLVERKPRRSLPNLAEIAALQVPGIARLVAWGSLPDGRPWFESELHQGPTLEELLRERTEGLSHQRTLQLFSGILDSLARAHAAGIPHGALDARRVVLLAGGQHVIVDHGLAYLGASPADRTAALARAPEVWAGRAPTARADVYSAGVLLFYALSGRYPFEATDLIDIARLHMLQKPPTLPEVGVAGAATEVDDLIARLLAKRPEDRPANGAAALEALERVRGRARTTRRPGPDPDRPSLPGYRFGRKLGEGASGKVFEATHETLARPVAIKVMRPSPEHATEQKARFLREARLAAQLMHPGIVQVVDAREEGDLLFLVMELVEGESVKARLAREGAFQEADALAVAAQVLDALAHAHERNVVHRDVKPDNLLMTSEGRVKIADFGLARSLDGSGPVATKHGTVLGTPLYMSPEQCESLPADPRSDLYSLGATLYHVLSGRPPFQAPTILQLLAKHVNEPPDPLRIVASAVSPETAAFVERLLRKDPAARFQSAREALAALPRSSRSGRLAPVPEP